MTVYIDPSGRRGVAPTDLTPKAVAWLRRDAARKQQRAELATARRYGLRARHTTKLRRVRGGDTNRKESSS